MNKQTRKIMFSSKKQEWKTPKKLYEELNKEFKFNFDPCPINPKFDGLAIEWKSRNYVNPPYDEKDKWIKKSYEECKKGKLVVLLLPAITSTKIFHKYIYHRARIRFIKGRLHFDGIKNPAPFASMIVIFKPRRIKK